MQTILPVPSDASFRFKFSFVPAAQDNALQSLLNNALLHEQNGSDGDAYLLYAKAAEQGDISAHFKCGEMLINGRGVKMDCEAALRHLNEVEKSQSTEFPMAYVYLGDLYMFETQQYLPPFSRKMNGTDAAKVMYSFCTDLEARRKIPADPKKAFQYYQIAAQAKCAAGHNKLGELTNSEPTVVKLMFAGKKEDARKFAISCFKSAAELGDTSKFQDLKMLCIQEKTLPSLVTWLKDAIANGIPTLWTALGDLYIEQENTQEAIKCYQNALDHKDPGGAYYGLGKYIYGSGKVGEDRQKAIEYCTKGAEMGHVGCWNELQKLGVAPSAINITQTSMDLIRADNKRYLQSPSSYLTPNSSYFFEAIASNKTLTKLNLDGEHIVEQEVVDQLANVLKSNDTLVSLSLKNNQMFKNNHLQSVVDALKVNTTLTSLDLRGNAMPQNAVETIVASSDETGAVVSSTLIRTGHLKTDQALYDLMQQRGQENLELLLCLEKKQIPFEISKIVVVKADGLKNVVKL